MDRAAIPGVSDRVKAIMLDTFIMICLMFIFSKIFAYIDHVPDIVRICAFVFVFWLYDPLFISLFGGTIGHFLLGLKVRRKSDHSKKILFPLALIRYLIKGVLGIISLLTISGNKERLAIHDIFTGSIVLYIKEPKTGSIQQQNEH